MSSKRKVLLTFGIAVLMVAVFFLFVGVTLLAIRQSSMDKAGFVAGKQKTIKGDDGSYAIVSKFDVQDSGLKNVPIGLDHAKVEASSNNGTKPVFIGLAHESDAKIYLNNVEYDEINLFVNFSKYNVASTNFPGTAAPASPASQTFWLASETGDGTQILDWKSIKGSYSIVIMNEDGSPGVDVNVRPKAGFPESLSSVGVACLVVGVVALVTGGRMVYSGARKEKAEEESVVSGGNVVSRIARNEWVVFLSRMVLGGIFVTAALLKLPDLDGFVHIVDKVGILPHSLAEFYGTVLPFAELIIGCLFLVGLFQRVASGVSIALIISFAISNIYVMIRVGGGEDCGCFGGLMNNTGALIIDLLMLVLALVVLFQRIKPKKKQIPEPESP